MVICKISICCRSGASLLLVGLTASVMLADTISGGTASFSGKLPFSNTDTPLTGLLQYNGSKPLQTIQFNFVTNVKGTLIITDGPGLSGPNPPQMVTVNFAAALKVYDPSGTNVLITSSPTASSQIVVPGDGTPVTSSAFASDVLTMINLSDPSQFAPFIGNSTLNLSIDGKGEVGFSPDLIVPFSVTDSGTANGTVQVNYISAPIPTPEPATASIFLLGIVLISAALLVERRQSRLSALSN